MPLSKKEEKEKLNEIYNLTSAFAKSNENSLTDILQIACSLLGTETGMVCVIKNDKYFLHDIYSVHVQNPEKIKNIELHNTLCFETIKENKLIAFSDINNSEYKNHPSSIEYKTACFIGIPIKFNEQENGSINFSSTFARKEAFTQTDIDLVLYLGQWVNHYLDREFYKNSLNNKKLELEILNSTLEKKNSDLKALMEEKNQLTQIMIHDLRSPLSNIKMLSYLFQDFVTDKASEELLEIFNKSLEYVFHLIEQMETLNSVENFPLNIYIEEFDLHLFLTENLKTFRSSAEAKSIKLNYTFSGSQSLIKTDANFLKRILHNLVSNALKFSSFDKNIAITLSFVNEHFEIAIKDEGPGISKSDQKKLFQKFNKLENKPTNNESSSGLGLFIVKELSKTLNGEIAVKSEKDKGSTFTIILPMAIEDNPS